MLTNEKRFDILTKSRGGIAQLARAIGSYPIGRGFKSNFRYQHKADVVNNKICLMIRPVGQAVKTPPFHGGNSSSILLRVTIRNKSELFRQSKLVRICFLLRVSKLNQKNLESNHFGRSRDSFVLSVVCTQRRFRGLGQIVSKVCKPQ